MDTELGRADAVDPVRDAVVDEDGVDVAVQTLVHPQLVAGERHARAVGGDRRVEAARGPAHRPFGHRLGRSGRHVSHPGLAVAVGLRKPVERHDLAVGGDRRVRRIGTVQARNGDRDALGHAGDEVAAEQVEALVYVVGRDPAVRAVDDVAAVGRDRRRHDPRTQLASGNVLGATGLTVDDDDVGSHVDNEPAVAGDRRVAAADAQAHPVGDRAGAVADVNVFAPVRVVDRQRLRGREDDVPAGVVHVGLVRGLPAAVGVDADVLGVPRGAVVELDAVVGLIRAEAPVGAERSRLLERRRRRRQRQHQAENRQDAT